MKIISEKGSNFGCPERRKLMMWMCETRIRLFMQMELEVCRDEYKRLLRCHRCIVNNCPEKYLSTHACTHSPDHARKLMRRWEIAKKGILPSTLKMTLKTYYPPPVHQPQPQPPQYDLPPRRLPERPLPVSPLSSSPLPCIEPESSEDDQIERDSNQKRRITVFLHVDC